MHSRLCFGKHEKVERKEYGVNTLDPVITIEILHFV